MPGVHALLSASGAARWIQCPPSVRFTEHYTELLSSVDAETGTLAHAIAEVRLGFALGQISKRTRDRRLKTLQQNTLYSPSMDEHLDAHVDYVLELAQDADEVLLEMRLDYSRWVPEGFGTSDVTIVKNGSIDVVDLKYGKGVPVSAENNPQLRLYGLGAYHELHMIYDIQEIRMHIVQPRLDSITTETLDIEDLLLWAGNVVESAAKLAFAGKGEFKSGDHCRWCLGKNNCRKYAFDKLELTRHEFKEPDALTDEEIAEIITQSDELARWAKSVKAYALEQALHHDKQWPGFKVVAGRSNRVITDEPTAMGILELEGFEPAQFCKLRGLGELEELVGKKKLPEMMGALLIKPVGAPALVPETDKRPAIDRNTQAKRDFEEE